MDEHDTFPTPSSECRACKEPIRAGAQRCTHCGTFQNWRRYLTFSGTVLSLLVALVSVLTVGIPVIMNELIEQDARLSVSMLERDGLQFMLLVSNSGQRATLLREVRMPLVFNGEDWIFPLEHTDGGEDWPIVLEPSSYKIFRLRTPLRAAPDYEATAKKFGCTLEFLFYHLDGRKEVMPFSCGKFKD